MQMVADLAAMPVEVVDIRESGCLGAAIAAAVGCGHYASLNEAMTAMCPAAQQIDPVLSATPRYAEKYAAFRQLARTLETIA